MSTEMTWQITTTDSADTQRLGRLLGSLLKAPAVLDLSADLGGGKTTFVRGLVAGAGSENNVTSPTFTLSRIYTAPNTEIHHFDFYRLDQPGIMADQLEESLQNPKAITVVEWSDVLKDVLPAERLSIEFKPTESREDERQITITYPESMTGLIKNLQTKWEELRP